jgi:hypothetical protein
MLTFKVIKARPSSLLIKADFTTKQDAALPGLPMIGLL